MKQITASKGTILYVMEQIYLKGYSDGRKNVDSVFEPSVVWDIAEQFTKDVEKYSNAKSKY